jgi:FAD/FMN-containing dehydrogenase
MRAKTIALSGWGKFPIAESDAYRPERIRDFRAQGSACIARGLGRSYGDATLNEGKAVILTERLNRFLAFDPVSGILRAEAGVSLEEILDLMVPQGWFLPVVPGTKFVTLGGAVAADIHGKNHHCDGAFSAHVTELTLVLADGSLRMCSPSQEAELFWATVGGMGLTGLIAEVALRLIPISTAFMQVQHHPAKDLDAVMALLDGGADAKYSVAWIDCLAKGRSLGRSVVMNGRHAEPTDLKRGRDPLHLRPVQRFSVPMNFPSWILNPLSIKAFNSLYYSVQSRKVAPFTVDYDSYFFPLDAIGDWNRIYGKRGFVQYQFVLPGREGASGLQKILERLATSRRASFLAVLKRFGEQGPGHLSFPTEGYTLALDIPVKDPQLFPLLDELDELVVEHHGRIYLAKDSRMQAGYLSQMYPRLEEWLELKRRFDPENRFSSDLSRRLHLGGM